MKSRIFIIVALIIFCITYTECRIHINNRPIAKFCNSVNDYRTENSKILKVIGEIQTTIVNDFYYEGKMK